MLSTLARFLLAITNLGVRGATWVLSRSPRDGVRRVLIHRVGRLGDGAAAWPALAAVRAQYPRAHIVLLTSTGETGSPGIAELARELVDEVRSYRPSDFADREAKLAFAKELGRDGIDLWQALPQVKTSPGTELRNLLFARLAGARRLRGFAVGNLWWLSKSLEKRLVQTTSEAQRLLRLTGQEDDRCTYDPTTAECARARELVPEAGVLALAPGSARSATRWAPDRFRALARRELERGGRVVVLGSAGERELADAVCLGLDSERAVSLAGCVDPRETIAVLRRARALVTNDSGAAHLGGLADLPVLVVQSARNVVGSWLPRGDRVRVEREHVDCGPCWVDDCPLDHRCLERIDAERVALALDELAPPPPTSEPGPAMHATG